MTVRISLAGRIAVDVDGQRLDERALPGGQPRVAFGLLVLERRRPVARNELAHNIWPSARPRSWKTALRGVIARVRSFLVDAGVGDSGVVRAEAGAYCLNVPGEVLVDVEQAADDAGGAARALRDGDAVEAQRLAVRARTVLVRPVLPGIDVPWLDEKRRQLSRSLTTTLETLAEARLVLGGHAHALRPAEEAIVLDPFRESAHRLVMRAHMNAGNVAAGLRAFERCRTLLADELGADPAPQTQELHAAMLSGEPPAVPDGTRSALLVAERAAAAPARQDACPYIGLRTFTEDDAEAFFGRGGDVARLLDRLAADDCRFLAVLGPSGSGKSSLVRAGLIPALGRGALPTSDTWPVCLLRPGADPLQTLASELTQLQPALDEAATARRLRDDAGALCDILEHVGKDGDARTVLVVDQLEEVLTLGASARERQAFLGALAVAATSPRSRAVIVVTLRADFYAQLAEHPRLADLASSRQFLVTPLDEVGLAEVIEGPARSAGVTVEAGLTATMLRDTARRSGSLPLLGHCLREVWERRVDGALTLAAYHDVGGVESALAQRAEAVYHELSSDERAVARRVLLRLTQAGDGPDDIRRRVPFAELPSDDAQRVTVEEVVGRLTEARLVTTGGPPRQDRWVEISHEALIRAWPRLQDWIDEEREDLAVHRRLTRAAGEWHRVDRDEDALYRGAQLAEAVAWATRQPGVANPLEQAFLDASIASDDARRRRRVRQLRLVAVSLIVAFVVLGALTALASVQRRRAEQQQQLATSRQLAAEALNRLAIEPAAGLSLAVDAVGVARTNEAVAALRRALITPRPRVTMPGGSDIAVDPTGRLVAVGSREGAATVRDLADGRLVHRLSGRSGGSSLVSFSPAGGLLATTDEDGARVWDMRDGTLRYELPHRAKVSAVAWSMDGRRIVTATFDETVRIWDADTGAVVATIDAPAPIALVQTAADGETVLAWSALDPEMFVFDAGTSRLATVFEGHAAAAVDARLSPDGQHAISVGLDGTARIWDATVGEEITIVEGFGEATWVGRFSPDGTHALVADATGMVQFVHVPSGEPYSARTAHAATVVDAAFSPDGKAAATVGADGTAVVWDTGTGRRLQTLRLDGTATLGMEARSVAFTSDGERLVTRAATVQVWDVPDGPAMVLGAHERHVRSLAVSPDGALLASGGADGTVRLWDVAARESRATADIAGSTVTAVSFSPSGDRLVTANPPLSTIAEQARQPRLWTTTGKEADSIAVPAPTGSPCLATCKTTVAAFSPDGSTLLTAGGEGVVRLWDAGGELVGQLKPIDRRLLDAQFGPDGGFVAAAARRTAPIWDADTGELVQELDARALAVAFEPAGEVLAVAGQDGVASLWDVDSWQEIDELPHAAGVNDVAWSSDGTLLLTAAGDGAHLWDVAARQHVQTFRGAGGARAVAFTADDDIVIGATDGAVRIHECVVCGPVDRLVDVAGRASARTP